MREVRVRVEKYADVVAEQGKEHVLEFYAEELNVGAATRTMSRDSFKVRKLCASKSVTLC